MSNSHASAQPASDFSQEPRDIEASYDALKLNSLIRNGSALAALVLAYSMEWMDLFEAGGDLSQVSSAGVSMSASVGARQSLVLNPGDMSVFGIPLTWAFVALLLSATLRVVFSRKRRLHPIPPLLLGAAGTVMLSSVLWHAIQDDTTKLFTSGFYIAFVAFTLNTLFDCIEYFDWRALRRAGRRAQGGS